jgi:hypothetical protein
MPDAIDTNMSGDFIITPETVIVNRDIYFEKLADRQIAFLKNREIQQQKIIQINKKIADEEKEITDLYTRFVLKIDKSQKDYLKSEKIQLYTKLSEAFPAHFEKHVQTITAVE